MPLPLKRGKGHSQGMRASLEAGRQRGSRGRGCPEDSGAHSVPGHGSCWPGEEADTNMEAPAGNLLCEGGAVKEKQMWG